MGFREGIEWNARKGWKNGGWRGTTRCLPASLFRPLASAGVLSTCDKGGGNEDGGLISLKRSRLKPFHGGWSVMKGEQSVVSNQGVFKDCFSRIREKFGIGNVDRTVTVFDI